MSDIPDPPYGAILWTDLTIADAPGLRDFYAAVTGWQPSPVDMGDYQDFNMLIPTTSQAAAGICHARGTNANVPPVWLIYIHVPDVKAAAEKAIELGGDILDGPRLMGEALFCVIKDPAGAICALFGPGSIA